MRELWIYLLVINVAAYTLMSIDKTRAQKGGRRIPERTLLLAAAAGGSPGAWLAMKRRRHKTKHAAFYLGIPILFAIQAACLIYWITRISER